MKIAHLILCHKNPEQVMRLVQRMAHPCFDFYIHVDKHADLSPWLPLQAQPNVYFIKNRVRTHWAGFSIVRATLNGFEQVLHSGHKYDHINLLSGQDYPLKHPCEIHNFYADNPGKAFMAADTFSHGSEPEAFKRITNYHFVQLRFRGRYTVERMADLLAPRRTFPDSFVPVGKSQWMTMPPECAAYILAFLKKERHIKKLFHYMWAPDEIIFQSVLYNSPFKDMIVNDNLRYVDWTDQKPNPRVLTMADAEKITASGKLFARKFDTGVDERVLDYLDRVMGS
jgi:hypothetical protein